MKKNIKNRREAIVDEALRLASEDEYSGTAGYAFMTAFIAGVDAMLEACSDEYADCAGIAASKIKKASALIADGIDEESNK